MQQREIAIEIEIEVEVEPVTLPTINVDVLLALGFQVVVLIGLVSDDLEDGIKLARARGGLE